MRNGVLLMAHGTPSSMDEMPEYLALVRGGRPASAELVEEMRHNYEAIGGRSPLTDLTLAQAAALRARLGPDIPVAIGMRNWKPFIKQGLAELADAGVNRAIGIPMAPQFSTLSVQKYIDSARGALPQGMAFDAVTSFHDHPLLIDAFAERVNAAAPLPTTVRLHRTCIAGPGNRSRRFLCGRGRGNGRSGGEGVWDHQVPPRVSECRPHTGTVDRPGPRGVD